MLKLKLFFCALASCSALACSTAQKTQTHSPMTTEPDRIAVDHILIAFAGSGTNATRSKADAEKLANELYQKLKVNPADFAAFKKQYSADPPPGGPYGLFQKEGAGKGNDFPRQKMVSAFGDVGFKLNVNEIGMANYDPKKSPYGWHIIKRVE